MCKNTEKRFNKRHCWKYWISRNLVGLLLPEGILKKCEKKLRVSVQWSTLYLYIMAAGNILFSAVCTYNTYQYVCIFLTNLYLVRKCLFIPSSASSEFLELLAMRWIDRIYVGNPRIVNAPCKSIKLQSESKDHCTSSNRFFSICFLIHEILYSG